MGACIVNVSPTGEVAEPAVQRAIQYAAARNVLVVCSAPDASSAMALEPFVGHSIARKAGADELSFGVFTDKGKAVVGFDHLAGPAMIDFRVWQQFGQRLLQALIAGLGVRDLPVL